MAGHVHDSSFNITANTNENPFLELVSGAIIKDEYATPEFISVDVNLDNGETEVTYYIWNTEYKYWSKTTKEEGDYRKGS